MASWGYRVTRLQISRPIDAIGRIGTGQMLAHVLTAKGEKTCMC